MKTTTQTGNAAQQTPAVPTKPNALACTCGSKFCTLRSTRGFPPLCVLPAPQAAVQR